MENVTYITAAIVATHQGEPIYILGIVKATHISKLWVVSLRPENNGKEVLITLAGNGLEVSGKQDHSSFIDMRQRELNCLFCLG